MPPNLDPSTRVDAYLDQLLVPLTRNLSAFHRDELRRELRAHLWGRIDAYRELDYSEEDAVTEALRQFGGANDFTKQWRQEWLTHVCTGTWREVWASICQALRLAIPALAATWLIAYVLGYVVLRALPSTYTGALLVVYSDALFPAVVTEFIGLSLWVGIVQGQRAARRGGWGMFAALSLVIVAGSAASLLGTEFGLEGTPCAGFYTSIPLMAAAWMPTACLAAAISGWLTQRKRVAA